jgi:hypothetical protein
MEGKKMEGISLSFIQWANITLNGLRLQTISS